MVVHVVVRVMVRMFLCPLHLAVIQVLTDLDFFFFKDQGFIDRVFFCHKTILGSFPHVFLHLCA